MMNEKDDFTFYHKSGSTATSAREVRDEYVPLGRHELQTLEKRAELEIISRWIRIKYHVIRTSRLNCQLGVTSVACGLEVRT
jgi:hypothetical protein